MISIASKIYITIQFKDKFNGVSDNLSSFISQMNVKNNQNFSNIFFKLDIQNKLFFSYTFFWIVLNVLFFFILRKRIYFIFPRSNSRLINVSFSFIPLYFYTFSDGLGDIFNRYARDSSKYYLGHFSNKVFYKNTLVDIPIKFYLETWKSSFEFSKNGRVLIILKKPNLPKLKSIDFVDVYQDVVNKISVNIPLLFCGDYKIFNHLILENHNYEYLKSFHQVNDTYKIRCIYSYPSTSLISFYHICPDKKRIHIIFDNIDGSYLKILQKMKNALINIHSSFLKEK